jgi:Arc/MetJ-type ribon-helix-helix transcriptional regulator
VEGQVASGYWGTPSEYIRELIRQDKERRMANLEQELLAAAKGPKIEVSLDEIRKKGLISSTAGNQVTMYLHSRRASWHLPHSSRRGSPNT